MDPCIELEVSIEPRHEMEKGHSVMAWDNRYRTVPVMCYVVSMVRFLWENLSLLQQNLKAHHLPSALAHQ